MISKYISYAEATKSQTAIRLGIDNTPDAETLERMKLVGRMVFDVVREHFGVRIYISSFYRSKAVNSKTKGSSKTSQHVTGEAIDIDADVLGGVTNVEIFEFIKKNLDFDQLIWEYGDEKSPAWVHVSYKKEGNRKQIRKKP